MKKEIIIQNRKDKNNNTTGIIFDFTKTNYKQFKQKQATQLSLFNTTKTTKK